MLSQVLLKDDRGQKIFDTAAGRYKTYPQSDDEAFKKAYTDALSNAMKFIGVAADVHMGLFDDNKYVQEVRSEFEAEKRAEVEAEIEHQKTGKEPAPINTLTNQLQASVAKETAKLTPEERAAEERNKLAQDIGTWSIDGNILQCCKIIGIQKKKKRDGVEFLSVTFNGRLPNGANFASVFEHTELYEALNAGLDKRSEAQDRHQGRLRQHRGCDVDQGNHRDGLRARLGPQP